MRKTTKRALLLIVCLTYCCAITLAQKIASDKQIYTPNDPIILEYTNSTATKFKSVFLVVNSSDGKKSFYNEDTRLATKGKTTLKAGRLKYGSYQAVLMNMGTMGNVPIATCYFVVGPVCVKGEYKCDMKDIKWESLTYDFVANNGVAITQRPMYKNVFKPIMDYLKEHHVHTSTVATPSLLFSGGALSTWLFSKLKEGITDPKKLAKELLEKIKSGAEKIVTKGGPIAPVAGLAPTLAYTVVAAKVDLEFLLAVLNMMPKDNYGIRLFVDVEIEKCVETMFGLGENTWKKSTKNVEFGPIDPASNYALTAITFNPVTIDDLLKLPLLKTTVSKMDSLSKNPAELAKAGITKAAADVNLKNLRDELAEAEKKVEEFKQVHKNKICAEANKMH